MPAHTTTVSTHYPTVSTQAVSLCCRQTDKLHRLAQQPRDAAPLGRLGQCCTIPSRNRMQQPQTGGRLSCSEQAAASRQQREVAARGSSERQQWAGSSGQAAAGRQQRAGSSGQAVRSYLVAVTEKDPGEPAANTRRSCDTHTTSAPHTTRCGVTVEWLQSIADSLRLGQGTDVKTCTPLLTD